MPLMQLYGPKPTPDTQDLYKNARDSLTAIMSGGEDDGSIIIGQVTSSPRSLQCLMQSMLTIGEQSSMVPIGACMSYT